MVGRSVVGVAALLHLLVVVGCVLLAGMEVPYDGLGLAGAGPAAITILAPSTAFVVVGLVIAWRRPRSFFGWALASYGLNFAVTALTESYAVAALHGGADLPAGEIAAWFQTWNWAYGLLLLSAIFLRFPTGDLPSSRWRWTTFVHSGLGLAITVAWVAVWPVRADPTLVRTTAAYPPVASAIQGSAEPLVMLLVGVGVVSLLLRYRRAGALERLQLRWLFSAAAVAAAGMVGFLLTGSGPGRGAPAVVEAVVLVGLTGVPVAMGVAVLRYRLFEIDRLIRRTVSYALVSAILAGVYAAGVLGAGTMAEAGRSDLVVALSTLVAAALFGPLRRGVQVRVDRRFNRNAESAESAVRSLAGTVREAVDLDRVVDGLAEAADTAVQPSHASVWLVGTGAVTVAGTGRT